MAKSVDFAWAAEEFGAAARLKPQDPDAEANLGAAFAELGEKEKAIAHLERALALDPGNQLARENLEAVRNAGPR